MAGQRALPVSGEPLVFLAVVACAPAVVGRDGRVRAGGWLPDHVRLGLLEQHLGAGVVEGLVAAAVVAGRVKAGGRRLVMSLELVMRFVVAMTLMPDACYREVMARLVGLLPQVPWARPWRVPGSKVITAWRRRLGEQLLRELFWHVAGSITRARVDERRVKPVGSGHSFTGIALAEDIRLDLSRLAGQVAAAPGSRLVTVPAGTTLRQLNTWLAGHGLALPNLGDIDAQTISGAISTGTHGTGAGFGGLATFVEALTLVTGTGQLLRCSATEHPDVFAAARVGLGALGVITELTLRCSEAFVLRADERPAPLADTLAGFEEHCAANEHVEFYWMPYTERTLLKRNNRTDVDSHPLSRLRAWWENDFLQNVALGAVCRAGRAVPAAMPRLARLVAGSFSPVTYTNRSDRIFTTPRRIRFVEMEYALPRPALPEAFSALRRIVDRLPFKVILPVEVRVSAADDIWLSHAHGRDSAYIAIHQYVGAPYQPYFRAFEEVCTGLGGRPHWGKLHWRDVASLAPAYPKFGDFLAVRDRLDPDRVFSNRYLDRVLGP